MNKQERFKEYLELRDYSNTLRCIYCHTPMLSDECDTAEMWDICTYCIRTYGKTPTLKVLQHAIV